MHVAFAPTKAPEANEKDNGNGNGKRPEENLNRSVQEAIKDASDPSIWAGLEEDTTLSDVSTEGNRSLFQDEMLPAELGGMSQAGETSSTSQSGGMNETAETSALPDLGITLRAIGTLTNDTSQLMNDVLSQNDGQFSSQAQQLVQSALTFDTQALNLASNMVNQTGSGFGRGGSDNSAGTTTAATGSDNSAGTTTAATGSDNSAGTTTAATGTDNSAGTTTAAGSDTGTATTPVTDSDTGGATTSDAGSDTDTATTTTDGSNVTSSNLSSA